MDPPTRHRQFALTTEAAAAPIYSALGNQIVDDSGGSHLVDSAPQVRRRPSHGQCNLLFHRFGTMAFHRGSNKRTKIDGFRRHPSFVRFASGKFQRIVNKIDRERAAFLGDADVRQPCHVTQLLIVLK
jgi:hypothetical protein